MPNAVVVVSGPKSLRALSVPSSRSADRRKGLGRKASLAVSAGAKHTTFKTQCLLVARQAAASPATQTAAPAAASLASATLSCTHPSSTMQHNTAAGRASILQLLFLCTVLTAPAAVLAEAEGRGVFIADSFPADMNLAVAKNRRTGPNHTVGPVPAGVAWDGARAQHPACEQLWPANLSQHAACVKGVCKQTDHPPFPDCLQAPTCGQQQEVQQTPST